MSDEKTTEQPVEPTGPFMADDSAMDKALESIIAEDDAAEEAPDESPDTPKEVKEEIRLQKEPPPEADDETPKAAEAEGGEDKPEPAEEDPELEKAIHALRRAKYPQRVIDSMTADEVRDLGAQAAETQAESQRLYQELQELKATAESNKESQEEPSATSAVPTGEPSEANLQKALEPIVDVLGEDSADVLAKAIDGAQGPLREENAQLRAGLDSLTGVILELKVDSAIGRLGGRYPGLLDLDAKGKQEITDRLVKSMQAGIYEGVDDPLNAGLNDIARIKWGEGVTEADLEREETLKAGKRHGRVQAPGRKKKRAPVTGEERDWAIFNALEDGNTQELKRLTGR